jgi:hypothetical protein
MFAVSTAEGKTAPAVKPVRSHRELLNIIQADAIGWQVITVINDILAKAQWRRYGKRKRN